MLRLSKFRPSVCVFPLERCLDIRTMQHNILRKKCENNYILLGINSPAVHRVNYERAKDSRDHVIYTVCHTLKYLKLKTQVEQAEILLAILKATQLRLDQGFDNQFRN